MLQYGRLSLSCELLLVLCFWRAMSNEIAALLDFGTEMVAFNEINSASRWAQITCQGRVVLLYIGIN